MARKLYEVTLKNLTRMEMILLEHALDVRACVFRQVIAENNKAEGVDKLADDSPILIAWKENEASITRMAQETAAQLRAQGERFKGR